MKAVESPPARRRWSRYALCAVLIAIALITGLRDYVGRFNGNIHVVDPNRVYRSGQLRGSRLAHLLTSRHIRSVVNLRGRVPGDPDLEAERSVCKRLGIAHVDIAFAPDRLPEPAVMARLLHELDTLPRPLLIHCSAGADRSGLASAIYLYVYKAVPLDRAQSSQLTWRYGHWSFWRGRAMEQFLNLYRRTGDGHSFRAWVRDEYPRVYAERQRMGHPG